MNEGPGEEDRIRGWLDPPLIPSGRLQAKRDGQVLAGKGISRLFTSDLARTQDSAVIIGDAVGLPPEPSMQFRPWNLGDFQGRLAKDVHDQIREYASNEKFDRPTM